MSEAGVVGLMLDETVEVRRRLFAVVTVMLRQDLHDLLLVVLEDDVQQPGGISPEPDRQQHRKSDSSHYLRSHKHKFVSAWSPALFRTGTPMLSKRNSRAAKKHLVEFLPGLLFQLLEGFAVNLPPPNIFRRVALLQKLHEAFQLICNDKPVISRAAAGRQRPSFPQRRILPGVTRSGLRTRSSDKMQPPHTNSCLYPGVLKSSTVSMPRKITDWCCLSETKPGI